MGGYWSEEKKVEEIEHPNQRFKNQRSRGSCEDEFIYTDYPIMVTTDRSKSASRLAITPTGQNSSDLKNYGVLPDLVLTNISLFLPLNDLSRMFRTCRLFYHCSNSNHFWRQYYQASFCGGNGDSEFSIPAINPQQVRQINWKKHFYIRNERYSDDFYRKKYKCVSLEKANNNNNTQRTSKLKCIFLGCGGVGKTSFVERVHRDTFHLYIECTIGAAYRDKVYYCERTDRYYDLQLWDTAGQERYRSIAPMYYRGADIVFLCFDISNRNSFDSPVYSFRNMFEDLKKHRMQDGIDIKGDFPAIILMGMKNDLEKEERRRVVSSEEGMEFARDNREYIHAYIENSSKTGTNIVASVGIAMDLVERRLSYIECGGGGSGKTSDLFYEEDLSENRVAKK